MWVSVWVWADSVLWQTACEWDSISPWHPSGNYKSRFLFSQLHSDIDSGDGNIKYILSGEGAGTIFVIDDKSGNIHATKTLDREERAQYTLMAQAVDRDTNRPLEPPSEFIVKVQDINDNPPEFLHETYHANVPERSNVGAYMRGHLHHLQASCPCGVGGYCPFSQIRKQNLHCIFYDIGQNKCYLYRWSFKYLRWTWDFNISSYKTQGSMAEWQECDWLQVILVLAFISYVTWIQFCPFAP